MAEKSYFAAVVGAGPAGMFAARELARNGVKVMIFNRDIKPGGLAEYGIYPDKLAMKGGLRTQFSQILDTPNLTYFGNVTVGEHADLTLEDLRQCGFQAILVTAGAQGTKWLGLPGENLKGVYHAKDLVFHYNQLPPYSKKRFHLGDTAAIVGAGNVMLDIARYLIEKVKVKNVIAVVRRGPAEIKFDKKEMEYVVHNLDLHLLDEEIMRVKSRMIEISQDPAAAREQILEALPRAVFTRSAAKFQFQFLSSPVRILGDEKVTGLEVEENSLFIKDGEVKALGTGNKKIISVDSVIFAIGDKVDTDLGLPADHNEYSKNPQPRFPIEGISYETFDAAQNRVIPDVFVAGWSRQASTGLVGYARKDGTYGSRAVLQYLQTLETCEPDVTALNIKLRKTGKHIVSSNDIHKLIEVEAEIAHKKELDNFKFGTNEEMLAAIMSIG